jgi:hypothetical protein
MGVSMQDFLPGVPPASTAGPHRTPAAHNEAVATANNYQMRNALGLGLGGGAALAGVAGLYNLWRRQHAGPQPTRLNPMEVVVDIPVEQEEDQEGNPSSRFYSSVLGRQRKSAAGEAPAPAAPPTTFNYTGSDVTLWPGVMAGLGFGGLASWKLVQHLNRKAYAGKQDADINDARKSFEQAMLRQYDSAKPLAKAASVIEHASCELDRLYDAVEKRGSAGLRAMLGRYLGLYALPMGAGAAYLGYRQAADSGDAVTAEKARKTRLAQHYQQSPPEVFARPVPVKMPKPEPDKEEITTNE